MQLFLFFLFSYNFFYCSTFILPELIEKKAEDNSLEARIFMHSGPLNKRIESEYKEIFAIAKKDYSNRFTLFRRNKKEDIIILKNFFESIIPVDFLYDPKVNNIILKLKSNIIALPPVLKININNNYRSQLEVLSFQKGSFPRKTKSPLVEIYRAKRKDKANLYNFSIEYQDGFINFIEFCFDSEKNAFYVQFLYADKRGRDFVNLIINILNFLYNKKNAPRYCIFFNAAFKGYLERVEKYYQENWGAIEISPKNFTFGYEAFDQNKIEIEKCSGDNAITEEDMERFLIKNNVNDDYLAELYPLREFNQNAKL